MGKEINYIATMPVNDMMGKPNGNPLDSDLFYDDMGATMEFSNCCGSMSSNADAATVQAGLVAAGQVAGAVGSVGGKGKTDVKQACGSRPFLAKNRAAYDKCVAKYNAGTLVGKQTKDGTMPNIVPSKPTGGKKDNTTTYVVVGSAIAIGLFLLYMKKK